MTAHVWTCFGTSTKVPNKRYVVLSGDLDTAEKVAAHMKADQPHFTVSSIHPGAIDAPPDTAADAAEGK